MRDARINPVAGDVLAIGMKQWEVSTADSGGIIIVRNGAKNFMSLATFRSLFKLASTVRYGDERD